MLKYIYKGRRSDMKKIYLKYYYDEKNIVECDYGTAWKMLYEGPFYALRKKNIKLFLLVLILQIAIVILFLCAFKLKLGIIISILMIALINFLFALNYNMIIIEKLLKMGYIPYDYNSSTELIKKGIYFKIQ